VTRQQLRETILRLSWMLSRSALRTSVTLTLQSDIEKFASRLLKKGLSIAKNNNGVVEVKR